MKNRNPITILGLKKEHKLIKIFKIVKEKISIRNWGLLRLRNNLNEKIKSNQNSTIALINVRF